MGNICDVLQLETGKMQAYQGSEEAEVHYEEYKKKSKSPTPGFISVCLSICVLLRNIPESLLTWSFDVDVGCWPC